MINLYVGNLPYSVVDKDLEELFAPFGPVASAQVIIDRRSRRSRGYGFVEMENEADGKKAVEALNDTEFQGRQLRVDESKPRENKRERGTTTAPSAGPATQPATASAPAPAPAGVRGLLRRLFG